MTVRRQPLPSRRPAEEHCDDPPAGFGPAYAPPHPIWGVAFVFLVAETLAWGALRAGSESGVSARLALARAAALACTCGAVLFLDRVLPRHLAAKLGLRRPAASWLGLAVAASLAAWIAIATGAGSAGAPLRLPRAVPIALPWGALAIVSSLWQEAFFRGWAFTGLMRRHGFAFSAGSAALLCALDLGIPASSAMSGASGLAVALLLEIPLSLALARVAWMTQSVWPGLLVRASVLFALFAGAVWPMAAGAAVLWIGTSWLARRRA